MSAFRRPAREAGNAGSLRRRLLLSLSLTTLAVYVVAALLTWRQARHEVQELMDGQISKAARLLLVQAHSDPNHLAALDENMRALHGLRIRRNDLTLEFRIIDGKGNTLARSSRMPDIPLARELGYEELTEGTHPWRTLMLATPDGAYRVQVAQSIKLRNREALEIAMKTILLPLGIFLPLLILGIYLSVRRSLAPLEALAEEVAARNPENLAALSPTRAPAETQPLVRALNQLFERLAGALDNERRFTADAAHELRTPLAALKVQAQVARASRDGVQQHALDQLVAGTDRATRLVEQLLRLARLDPLQTLPAPQTVDLVALAEQVLADAQATATARKQSLTMRAPAGPLSCQGDHDLLAVALRNLLDNALRYTPEGGQVQIRVEDIGGRPCITVEDDGPGVPPEELPQLAQRFYRGRANRAEGSGLGLAIVRRIGELHGARLEANNRPGGGFAACLRWQA